MKKNINVTIGIPAHNEENNITQLLKALLVQEQINYSLQAIIVVSDGSTDNTVNLIKSLKNDKIKLIENKKRIGVAKTQNLILNNFESDILVIINADVLPMDSHLVSSLVTPFLTERNVGIVGGKVVPNKAKNFIEHVINTSVEAKSDIYERTNSGNNIYTCHGRVRAFSSEFLKKFSWPDIITEDAYSYLCCIKKNFKYFYSASAAVYYRSPQNYIDHYRQSKRFLYSKTELEKYFDKNFIDKNYNISIFTLAITTFKHLICSPIYMSVYFIVFFSVKLASLIPHSYDSMWVPSLSSKKL